MAGVSTRAAAESAARAGFNVTAIDAFGDHIAAACRSAAMPSDVAHRDQPGTWRSSWVKITGSPPIGKSRRWGQPT